MDGEGKERQTAERVAGTKLQRQQGRQRERAGTETVEEREAGVETLLSVLCRSGAAVRS